MRLDALKEAQEAQTQAIDRAKNEKIINRILTGLIKVAIVSTEETGNHNHNRKQHLTHPERPGQRIIRARQ